MSYSVNKLYNELDILIQTLSVFFVGIKTMIRSIIRMSESLELLFYCNLLTASPFIPWFLILQVSSITEKRKES